MRGATVLTRPARAEVAEAPPMHRLHVPTPNLLPLAVGTFDTFGPEARADFPHRHTFYEIVHVTGGTGSHVVDLARWPLRPPHLCVIVPGQVHHWEDARDLEGSLLLFTDHFLVDHPEDRELLRRLGGRPWLSLDPVAQSSTTRLMDDLHEEYRRGADGFDTVLRSLLHVLVVRAARAARLSGSPLPAPVRTRADVVAVEFARLIADADPALWSVAACAERIGVSPGHLTEAVKTATGRTPGRLIREARTAEAKRLLARTDLTVRQVAVRVGLADPAYFCRFFRRETGVSPGDFRRGGEIHHDHRIPSIAANWRRP
ncbi:AraC family transcriptional regulator [Streptomyces pyxinae]|uniref:helix-turn-helix transcriptional regulator n=1 Tax=Streptomyces pyxinae TaxID=2970734 RepID=UPI003D183727